MPAAFLNSLEESEIAKLHGVKAATWAAAAFGASFRDQSTAKDYLHTAITHLRQCFDVPCEESLDAYLMIGEASFILGEIDQFCRYAEFAAALEQNMLDMSQTLPADCRAAVWIVRHHAHSHSNSAQCQHMFVEFPAADALHNLDIRFQFMYHVHVSKLRLRQAADPRVPRHEKFKCCEEVISVLEALVSQMDSGSNQNVFGRFSAYCLLAYCWAACGDFENSRLYSHRWLDVLEQNLFLVSLNVSLAQDQSWLFQKLEDPNLQLRANQILAAGATFRVQQSRRRSKLLAPVLQALISSLQLDTSEPSPAAEPHSFDETPSPTAEVNLGVSDHDEDFWRILDAVCDATS